MNGTHFARVDLEVYASEEEANLLLQRYSGKITGRRRIERETSVKAFGQIEFKNLNDALKFIQEVKGKHKRHPESNHRIFKSQVQVSLTYEACLEDLSMVLPEYSDIDFTLSSKDGGSQTVIFYLKENVFSGLQYTQLRDRKKGIFDSHCHLDLLRRRTSISTFSHLFEGCITVFCDPSTFKKTNIWMKILSLENVWATFGCHPKYAYMFDYKKEKYLLEALKNPKVKALGEIGLDYAKKTLCSKNVQIKVFKKQVQLAKDLGLPLVIHCREAHDDTMAILKEMLPREYKIHLHCFTESWAYAEKWLEEFSNLCIGVTSLVTYPAVKVHEVVRRIPITRLLLETDAPYFVPKNTGMKNMRYSHPGLISFVAEEVARIKKMDVCAVLENCRKNVNKIYNI